MIDPLPVRWGIFRWVGRINRGKSIALLGTGAEHLLAIRMYG